MKTLMRCIYRKESAFVSITICISHSGHYKTNNTIIIEELKPIYFKMICPKIGDWKKKSSTHIQHMSAIRKSASASAFGLVKRIIIFKHNYVYMHKHKLTADTRRGHARFIIGLTK